MPYLPELTEGNQSRAVVDVFGGYNHNLKISEGEWFDEKNLSCAHYPMFSQRKRRGVYAEAAEPVAGIIAKDALAWIDGEKLYYNGYQVDGVRVSTRKEDYPKQMVSMGAYLCIFPDGVYVNTKDLSDYGSMGAEYKSGKKAVTFTPCRITGEAYDDSIIASTSAPDDPANGDYWLDTSGDTHVLKQFSSSTDMWVQVPTVYTKIQCDGIGSLFNVDDGVHISGVQYSGEDDAVREQLAMLNTNAVIQGCADDYIIIIGLIDREHVQTASITVERKVPRMSYVCESNNRLWGCYYGITDGKSVNEIYACKQGDFRNWNCFAGISTDSYSVSVGSDGEFTGCIAYAGSPVFFKENYIHKLHGSAPNSFGLNTTACRGVQRGSSKSLAIVNEILYYKSRSDICAYDGAQPTGVSVQLGDVLYYDACAGAHGGKYYVSMCDGSGVRSMFVYDTLRGIWHKEDDVQASGFAAWGDEIFFTDGNRIVAENGTVGELEAKVHWEATSGLIGYELMDHQYVSRFNFRMMLGDGARCMLAIEYDSSGVWMEQGAIYGRGTDSFVVPVIPRRCDHFRIRLSGEGDVKIYSIAKIIEQGSDV